MEGGSYRRSGGTRSACSFPLTRATGASSSPCPHPTHPRIPFAPRLFVFAACVRSLCVLKGQDRCVFRHRKQHKSRVARQPLTVTASEGARPPHSQERTTLAPRPVQATGGASLKRWVGLPPDRVFDKHAERFARAGMSETLSPVCDGRAPASLPRRGPGDLAQRSGESWWAVASRSCARLSGVETGPLRPSSVVLMGNKARWLVLSSRKTLPPQA